MKPLPEQAELTAGRVLEEYKRTGTLPGPFIRSVQAQKALAGTILTYEVVEREVRRWVDRWLAQIDRGAEPETAAQD